jgi:streptogramin lyase
MPAGSAQVSGLKKPFGVAVGADAIWATEYELGYLVRIDPKAARIVARTRVGAHASHIVVNGDLVWVVDDLKKAVVAVDTRTARVVKEIPLQANAALAPNAIAAGEGSLWVTLGLSTEYATFLPNSSTPPSQLVRISPGSNAVLSTISVRGVPAGVVVGGGAVWVASVLDPALIYRIDPATNRMVTIDTGHPVSGALAYIDPDLWVANRDGYLTRIDSRSNRVVGNFEVGSPEWPALVANANAVWISAPLDNLVAKFDPQTDEISTTIHTGGRPQIFAFSGDAIWVANYTDGTVAKLPTN